MEYIVQYREDQNIVAATAKGEWDPRVDNDMVREVMEIVEASGGAKVLLDIRELRFDISIVRALERALEVREYRQGFKTVSRKTAIVYSSVNERTDESVIFFETVSRNRGLPFLTFTDMDKAMAWLLEDK